MLSSAHWQVLTAHLDGPMQHLPTPLEHSILGKVEGGGRSLWFGPKFDFYPRVWPFGVLVPRPRGPTAKTALWSSGISASVTSPATTPFDRPGRYSPALSGRHCRALHLLYHCGSAAMHPSSPTLLYPCLPSNPTEFPLRIESYLSHHTFKHLTRFRLRLLGFAQEQRADLPLPFCFGSLTILHLCFLPNFSARAQSESPHIFS